jgi:hypothetical protein
VLFLELRDCGRQNVVGEMIDELMIVAGASERLVPGLIKNMEGSLSREKKKNRPQ